jgi:AcrR family transcriptional regulator
MARQAESGSAEGQRLDVGDWSQAALGQLASHGIDGVRVELLAKQLGVTKGSFYWHFRDRDALYEQMLSDWRRSATLSLIERLDRGETGPEARLRRLLQLPVVGRKSAHAADVELAIRLWSRRDERARLALEEVDQLRLRYITELLILYGLPRSAAEPRAVLAYAYMRVAATLIDPAATQMMHRCESVILDTDPGLP